VEEEALLGLWVVVDIIDDFSTPEEIAQELAEVNYFHAFMPFNMGLYWVEVIGQPNTSDIIPSMSWFVNNGFITMTSDTTRETSIVEYTFDGDLLFIFDPMLNETLIFERVD